MSREGSRIFEEEERVGVVIKGVGDGGSGSFDGVDVVAAVVVNSTAEIKCSVTVMAPAWAGFSAKVGSAELARGVKGMCFEVELVTIQAVKGGNFGGS